MVRFVLSFVVLLLLSCRSDKRYHDARSSEAGDAKEITATYTGEILALRQEKDDLFKDPKRSPLSQSALREFSGLRYFGVDSTFKVEAKLERTVFPRMVSMDTTTDEVMVQEEYGTLIFTISGIEYQLKVYRDPELQRDPQYMNYLFLPFTDLTNGAQTYGGGRYLDLNIPEGDALVLDFNKAYNPYCAYNSRYSCPLVPPENHLNTGIEAGEKILP